MSDDKRSEDEKYEKMDYIYTKSSIDFMNKLFRESDSSFLRGIQFDVVKDKECPTTS